MDNKLLWYNNLSILLNSQNEYNRVGIINGLAQLSILLFIIIIIFNINYKLISISVILIVISIYLGLTNNLEEKFTDKICHMPTKNNPFMNYTIGDLIDNPNRLPACKYDNVKKKIKDNFKSHIYIDYSELWGKFISDRNFYTMPNTDIVNDQTKFALWCYGNEEQLPKSDFLNSSKVKDGLFN